MGGEEEKEGEGEEGYACCIVVGVDLIDGVQDEDEF